LQTENAAPEQIEETPAPEEQKEQALTGAVSEVLGEQKSGKKDKKLSKKFKTQIAKFSADGFDVSALEAMMETASADELKEILKVFEEGIEAIKAIKTGMSEMDLTGLEKEVEELNELLSDPTKHQKATALFGNIKFNRRANEILAAVNKMVLPSMKEKADAFKAVLETSRDLEAIEAEFSNLKRDYKEAYAEEGVKAQVTTAQTSPARTEPRSKMPMTVKDIFLLYRDGKFISHHTNRVVSKEQQKELFADLKTGRDFLRSPKYTPQKLNVISAQSRNILVQSGRFTVVIIIAEGSVDPWSEKITSKVIALLEKEDQMQLKDWNGDVSALKSSGKYMQALLFAFMKLSKKGQQ
jgi:hypothetical protein